MQIGHPQHRTRPLQQSVGLGERPREISQREHRLLTRRTGDPSRCSETRLLSGLRPISKEVWITWRRPVSKTIATAAEVVGTAAAGPDAAKTAASSRDPSASADAGSRGSARVSGSRPRVRSAVTVRRIQCEGVKRAINFRMPTGLPVRSSTVRRFRARRPRVRPRRTNNSNWPIRKTALNKPIQASVRTRQKPP